MITFSCKPDDGENYQIIADSRDVIEWEVRKNGRHMGMITSTPRMQDMAELAWLASRRQKVWTGDLADFRLGVAVEPMQRADDDESDELLDPTQTTA